MDTFFEEKVAKLHGYELTDEDVKQILRRTLKLSPKMISDPQIKSLCAIIDSDCGGTVGVHELREFIDKEQPETRTVASFGVASQRSAKEKRVEVETEMRPPIESLPYLKPSQISALRKRIRSAASLAAKLQGLAFSDDAEAIAKLFMQFDKDGCGELQDLEVRKAIRATLKIPKTFLGDNELWMLIHTIDSDQSGCIVVQEFVDWVMNSENPR